MVALYAPGGGRIADGPQPQAVLRGAPGDGKNDTLNADIVLHGVKGNELGQWTVDLVLGGHVIRDGLTPEADHRIDTLRYRIPVRDIDVGRDLVDGGPDTLEAVAHLPEGGESRTLAVIELTSNWFTYTVGVDATGDQNGWIWIGTVTAPGMDPTSGLCHTEIHFVPAARGTGLAGMTAMPLFSLSIATSGGLQVGGYNVGFDEALGAGGFSVREANPETFFAGLSAKLVSPASEQAMAWGRSEAGFFSTGDSVYISEIDSTRIAGSFDVDLRGFAALDGADQFQIVEARAAGDFSGPFAPDSPEREILARINRPYEDVYNCQAPTATP